MEKTMCELFAGVGGFRLGMERLRSGWKTVWFSQWEPEAMIQWAHDCYVRHYGDCQDIHGEYHTGDDICLVDKNSIPDHTLLVGGFPCQDYSVAHALQSSEGIEGKKGVLWWQIRDTIIAKRPPFCIFENVDRLLKSPYTQRGRDFGIILACLLALGYSIEWRVINAAHYGAAQRRRRTFIFAYRDETEYGKTMDTRDAVDIISKDGLMARAFPIKELGVVKSYPLDKDIAAVSDKFAFPFENAGYAHAGVIYNAKVQDKEEFSCLLGSVLQREIDERFYISDNDLKKYAYLKMAKKIPRETPDGHLYIYSEGPIEFPDPWDRPERTMLTSEATLNRATHVVADLFTERLRLLTPIEAERMQGFMDDWTLGMPNRMRYFCMGNALVVTMVTRMGAVLDEIVEQENRTERRC